MAIQFASDDDNVDDNKDERPFYEKAKWQCRFLVCIETNIGQIWAEWMGHDRDERKEERKKDRCVLPGFIGDLPSCRIILTGEQ